MEPKSKVVKPATPKEKSKPKSKSVTPKPNPKPKVKVKAKTKVDFKDKYITQLEERLKRVESKFDKKRSNGSCTISLINNDNNKKEDHYYDSRLRDVINTKKSLNKTFDEKIRFGWK